MDPSVCRSKTSTRTGSTGRRTRACRSIRPAGSTGCLSSTPAVSGSRQARVSRRPVPRSQVLRICRGSRRAQARWNRAQRGGVRRSRLRVQAADLIWPSSPTTPSPCRAQLYRNGRSQWPKNSRSTNGSQGRAGDGATVSVPLPLLEIMLNGNGTAYAQTARPVSPVFVMWFFGKARCPGTGSRRRPGRVRTGISARSSGPVGGEVLSHRDQRPHEQHRRRWRRAPDRLSRCDDRCADQGNAVTAIHRSGRRGLHHEVTPGLRRSSLLRWG